MKVIIWVHKDDIISGKITNYHNFCPQGGRWMDYYQIQITSDEFAILEDKERDYTYPEFVEKHYDKPVPDIIKKHQDVKGGDFPKWWKSLTKEEQATIQEYYGR